jgi:hypothetical protein
MREERGEGRDHPRGEEVQYIGPQEGSHGSADIGQRRSSSVASGQGQAAEGSEERRQPEGKEDSFIGNRFCCTIGNYGHHGNARGSL